MPTTFWLCAQNMVVMEILHLILISFYNNSEITGPIVLHVVHLFIFCTMNRYNEGLVDVN